MLDSRGKLLEAGHKVAIGSSNRISYGTLVYDPDDIRYKRLHVKTGDYVRYFDKNARRVLSLTALIQDELDIPFVGVLH